MTIIPKIDHPNSGITYTRYSWKACVTEDGKRRYYSLGIKDKTDVESARAKRDTLYAVLRREGAIESRTPERTSLRRHTLDPADPKRYIHVIAVKNPYKVVIGGEVIGHYPTRQEAMLARNTALGLTEGGAE